MDLLAVNNFKKKKSVFKQKGYLKIKLKNLKIHNFFKLLLAKILVAIL